MSGNRVASMLGAQTGSPQLSEYLLDRLMAKKQNERDENVKRLSHEQYINYLLRELLLEVSLDNDWTAAMRKETISALAPIWFENFAMNIALGFMIDGKGWLSELDRQIAERGEQILREKANPTIPKEMKETTSISTIPKNPGKPCLVVAAGPSIRERNHIKMLAERGWNGTIITTDRMLGSLLSAGVSPENGFDLKVATVDGHRMLIPRMFRDSEAKPLRADNVDGMMVSTAAPQAYIASQEAGVKTKWFHGMMDDFDKQDGISSAQNYMIGAPAISAGGNVGATCWTLGLYLHCNPIIYIGLDLGYTPETRIEDTAYYDGFRLSGASDVDIINSMTYGTNPDFGIPFMQDVVFVNYRKALLEMIRYRNEIECVIGTPSQGIYPVDVWNATEGGAFFGPYVKGKRFSDVLAQFGRG